MNQRNYYERVKASPAIKRAGGEWNAHSADIREMLGLGRKGKLPAQGMEPRVIQGVKVWVEPAAPARYYYLGPYTPKKIKSSAHRVLAECPRCGEHLSAGRLHQHVCK